jgi:lipopolysaccharide export system protein LptA
MNRNQTCKSSFHLSTALLVVFCAAVALAKEEDLKLPISLDADSTDYDGKSSMLMFSGLRLTQGSIGVQADEGRASKLDFEDSVWRFNGNVIFDVENGHIECDTADLSFSGHELRTAIITGSPATFEMRRPNSEETTYAEAGRLEYDFDTGIVTFSENATITEGGNQISSTYLVYDITEQRINARSGGDGDPKVRITYTPGAVEQIVPDVDAEEEIRKQLSPQDDASDASGDEVP